MFMRGIRGAVTIKEDQPEAILDSTHTLLKEVMRKNPDLKPVDIASVLFTTTRDISRMNPARAAREFGWTNVPLMCARETSAAGGLPRCIRVLILWNTEQSQDQIQHVYLGEAATLRPDLTSSPSPGIKK
jgi:chorismate mutase